MGGKKPFALVSEEAWIRARVEQKPEITGRELLAELNQRGIEVSYYGVWHFVDRLSFKKACTPANRIARTTSRQTGSRPTAASSGSNQTAKSLDVYYEF